MLAELIDSGEKLLGDAFRPNSFAPTTPENRANYFIPLLALDQGPEIPVCAACGAGIKKGISACICPSNQEQPFENDLDLAAPAPSGPLALILGL